MFAFLLGWFLKPSVDAVLADFNNLVTKLDNVVDFHNREASLQQEVIDVAHAAKDFAVKEATRAMNVARKLEELLR